MSDWYSIRGSVFSDHRRMYENTRPNRPNHSMGNFFSRLFLCKPSSESNYFSHMGCRLLLPLDNAYTDSVVRPRHCNRPTVTNPPKRSLSLLDMGCSLLPQDSLCSYYHTRSQNSALLDAAFGTQGIPFPSCFSTQTTNQTGNPGAHNERRKESVYTAPVYTVGKRH
jgi:hypothetical protein